MVKKNRGFNLSFFVILGVMFLMMYINKMSIPEETYTNGALVADLTEGNVSSISIQPNEETPTGSARILLNGGAVKTLSMTQTNSSFFMKFFTLRHLRLYKHTEIPI